MQGEFLITPVVDCSAFREVVLFFEEEFLLGGPGVTREILLSLDGGQSFEQEPISFENGPGWSLHAWQGLSIPRAAGRGEVAFAFLYRGVSSGVHTASGWWVIDNVAVYECSSEFRFRRGDANCDGRVDLSDVVTVLAALFAGGDPPCCRAAADAAREGTLDLASAVYLLNHLFLGGPPPPAPFPECGPPGVEGDIGLGCARSPACG